MKVVLAVTDRDAHIVGLIPVDADEVVFMNNWLHKREPGQYRPYKFKVYTFEPGVREPWALATLVYLVQYDNFWGKVSA